VADRVVARVLFAVPVRSQNLFCEAAAAAAAAGGGASVGLATRMMTV